MVEAGNRRNQGAGPRRVRGRLQNLVWCKHHGFTITRRDRERPLTPALSPRERENRLPLSGESNALGRAGMTALNHGVYGASGSDVRPKKEAGCQFPLPAGEGQGEGERAAANKNGRTNFASSTRPAPRVKVGYHIEPKACRAWERAQSQGSPTPDCFKVGTNSPGSPPGEGESETSTLFSPRPSPPEEEREKCGTVCGQVRIARQF
jgi:hypothetical protein